MPVDVNGINKVAGEWYHLLYGDVYGMRTTRLRLTNTYGPRMRVKDARQTFLGIWLRPRSRGGAILVYGDGSPAPRPHVRRRRGRRVPARRGARRGDGQGLQPRRRRPRLACSSSAETRDRDGGAGAIRLDPLPRRTARRSTSATSTPTTRRSRRELGWRPDVSARGGLARTLDVLPRARRRTTGADE